MTLNGLLQGQVLSLRATLAGVGRSQVWLSMAAALAVCQPAPADSAVSVNSGGLAIAFSINDVSQGWRFNVDAPIHITALGLLDADEDGFVVEHPIAIWDAAGEMMAFATLQKGTVNPLIDRFRYAEPETDGPVILSPGQDYTIGYFLPGDAFEDAYVIWNGVHSMHPVINQVGARFFTLSSDLEMPDTPDAVGSQCFGPGFQFTVVPGPSAALLLALTCMHATRRRR